MIHPVEQSEWEKRNLYTWREIQGRTGATVYLRGQEIASFRLMSMAQRACVVLNLLAEIPADALAEFAQRYRADTPPADMGVTVPTAGRRTMWGHNQFCVCPFCGRWTANGSLDKGSCSACGRQWERVRDWHSPGPYSLRPLLPTPRSDSSGLPHRADPTPPADMGATVPTEGATDDDV